jgi:hypothetical protein
MVMLRTKSRRTARREIDSQIPLAMYRAVRDRDPRSLHFLRVLREEIVAPDYGIFDDITSLS